MKAGDVAAMPADIRHQGYSRKRSMLLVWENANPDLPRMHAFYIELLNALVAEHYGIEYADPLFMPDAAQRAASLSRLVSLCETERTLYEQQTRIERIRRLLRRDDAP